MKKNIKLIIDFLESKYGKEKHFYYNPFKTLITCVLSQRTRDENTEKASRNLFRIAKTPKQILKLPDKKLQQLIKPSGFYRQKAKRIKQISKIILEKGKVPKTKEELLGLPGVGFKTADVVLMYGYGMPSIPVDTHVNQISKRLGLVDQNAGVEGVRLKLESILPKNKWYLINHGFVRFGQEICLPRNPKCDVCFLLKICPFGKNRTRGI